MTANPLAPNYDENLSQVKGAIEYALKTEANVEAQDLLKHAQTELQALEDFKKDGEKSQIATAEAHLRQAKSDIDAAIAACGSHVSPALERAQQALARLSSVTSIDEAKIAESTAATAEQDAGDQEVKTMTSAVAEGAMGLASLVGLKDTVSQISKWNARGMEAAEYGLASLTTPLIQHGLQAMASIEKIAKASGLPGAPR